MTEKLKAELGEAQVAVQLWKERCESANQTIRILNEHQEKADAELATLRLKIVGLEKEVKHLKDVDSEIEVTRFRALFEEQKLEREAAEYHLSKAVKLISRWIGRLPDKTIGGHLADLLRDSREFIENQPTRYFVQTADPVCRSRGNCSYRGNKVKCPYCSKPNPQSPKAPACGTSKAPSGWSCSRAFGHEGPCAASPLDGPDGEADPDYPGHIGHFIHTTTKANAGISVITSGPHVLVHEQYLAQLQERSESEKDVLQAMHNIDHEILQLEVDFPSDSEFVAVCKAELHLRGLR